MWWSNATHTATLLPLGARHKRAHILMHARPAVPPQPGHRMPGQSEGMNFTQRLLFGVASVGLAAAGALGLSAGTPSTTASPEASGSQSPLRGTTPLDGAATLDGTAPLDGTATLPPASIGGWRTVEAGALLSGRPAEITARVSARASQGATPTTEVKA